ncbi:LLM class F420-dependent oxidoreductase [Acrocarpospora corrugata]|uniref:LLM class F420-dependent oxidoreductase n=1 Tax=Acrocarpospora corrugata TaxID=35763 RepID=A0A5M3W358_9ACTN|nr:LLM class flavin-dependent oxidoreductase [Acrocarpospora corrugata]GES03166.1 LLM class F420-dependent oxidoreductase [Acrocarpospora corrugata]
MSHRVGAALEPQGVTLQETLERVDITEEMGADSQWLIQMPGQWESGTVLAALAARTERITLGSAILPLYSRPPVAMASTALTLGELSGGRFVLGLGLGHRDVGEWMVGAGAAPPAVPGMREYLEIVLAAIQKGEADHDGKWFGGHVFYPPTQERHSDLPVYVGTFGPRMLELAGEVADGVILWMCTPSYVRDVVMPALRRGFARRTDGRYPGGAGFEVAALICAAVTPEVEADQTRFGEYLSAYVRVPTYRRLFEASGFGAQIRAGRPDEEMIRGLSAIGGPAESHARMAAYAAEGVTQMLICPAGSAFLDRGRYLDTVRAALA